MKKLLSIVLLLSLVLTLCACGGAPVEEPSTEPSSEATEPSVSEENQAPTEKDEFADVNELEPNDKGVYQIHSPEGVKNIANHPDADFELLRDVDMGGETIAPVSSFTGDLDGANFTVSNFTVAGSVDGNVGLVGLNKGKIRNLGLKNATVITDENTKHAGVLAGINEGDLSRCTVTASALNAEKIADGANCGSAAGCSSGDIRNTNVEADITLTTGGIATVGGLVAVTDGGKYQYCDVSGAIVVNGTSVDMGLLVGSAKNCEIKACAFVGPKNTKNGQLVTALTVASADSEITKCLWRDNSAEPVSEQSLKLRSIAEQYMRAMGSIEWYVDRTLYRDCHCGASMCYGAFYPGTLHKGVPYNHKGSGLESAQYMLDENNFIIDWVYEQPSYDGWDMYIGNDCSTSVQKAWARVSNTISFTSTRNAAPIHGCGTIAVGDWEWNLEPPSSEIEEFKIYREKTGEQRLYEAYGQLRMADGIVCQYEGMHHIRMAAADAVVVRDQDGLIDPTYSYVLCHEQGSVTRDTNFYTSWKLDHKYTFANLYEEFYMPFTCEEFLTGEMEAPEAKLEGSVGGKAGLTTGVVVANYFVDSVTLAITDENGNEVFTKRMFSTTDKLYNSYDQDDVIRALPFEFDMGMFAAPLMTEEFALGQTYNVTVTAHLGTGDDFTVNEYSFTHGQV